MVPGTQEPVHWPLLSLHTYAQAEPLFTHVPVASHTCGWSLLHCFAPGVQLPPHVPVPALQTYGQALPLFAQAPAELQTCGWSPLHCLAAGVQALHVPPLQMIGQAAPRVCHSPLLSHC